MLLADFLARRARERRVSARLPVEVRSRALGDRTVVGSHTVRSKSVHFHCHRTQSVSLVSNYEKNKKKSINTSVSSVCHYQRSELKKKYLTIIATSEF